MLKGRRPLLRYIGIAVVTGVVLGAGLVHHGHDWLGLLVLWIVGSGLVVYITA